MRANESSTVGFYKGVLSLKQGVKMKHLVKHFAKMGLLIAMAASLAACSDEPTASDIQQAAAQAMEMDIDRQIGGDHPRAQK